jgi:type 1 glutamine amidotransferase
MAVKIPLWKRMVKFLLLTLVVLFLAVATLVWFTGTWNIIYPSTQHDTQAPWIPAALVSPAVLVFSKTNSFRHIDGIKGGNLAFGKIAQNNGWGLFASENGAVFNDQDLKNFDTVVFLNASGDMLSADQERAFQSWLEAGGGWLGIHAAGDGSHAAWTWYGENLIGADFTAHILGPQYQRAKVIVESPEHPVAANLPNTWLHSEEWYSWEKSPRGEGFNIVAIVDEGSYTPVQKFLGNERDLRMGDHPVVWTQCVGKGRAVYSALGHKAKAFEEPEHQRLLKNALSWTMGLTGETCGASPGL